MPLKSCFLVTPCSQHVQGCFDRERHFNELIDAAETVDTLTGIDITEGWGLDMALPTSGLITLAQIGFEAGITQPYTLAKLYGKMGAPTAGYISLTHFYGKSNAFTR